MSIQICPTLIGPEHFSIKAAYPATSLVPAAYNTSSLQSYSQYNLNGNDLRWSLNALLRRPFLYSIEELASTVSACVIRVSEARARYQIRAAIFRLSWTVEEAPICRRGRRFTLCLAGQRFWHEMPSISHPLLLYH